MSVPNPYRDLPASAFWRTAIAGRRYGEVAGLWRPKLPIRADDVFITAGSCFAQHLGQALLKHGFDWLDAEPGPERVPPRERRAFGYGVFSFRTGNIYNVALLRQWIEAAFDVRPLDDELWETGGRWYDPLRPAIEPNGFSTRQECLVLRGITLAAIRRAFTGATRFAFTLGLTEGWRNRASGLVYAMCPGTVAGTFDDAAHEFVDFDYPTIHEDLCATLDLITRHNANLSILLTVSPIPLTATASGAHVLTATTHSKSVLRAVAGTLARQREDTDYFPAYEVVSSPASRGRLFEANMRSVNAAGVDLVMSHFFAGIDGDDVAAAPRRQAAAGKRTANAVVATTANDDDIACEEAMLDAFGPLPLQR